MKRAVCLAKLCCGALGAQAIQRPEFFARRVYPSAFGFVSVADINGDNIPDDGSLEIALGKGDGTFRETLTVGVGQGAGQIFLQNLHRQAASQRWPAIVSPDSFSSAVMLINLTK